VRDPGHNGRGGCAVKDVFLQPWHISTEAHDTYCDDHAIDGDAVLVHAMVPEDGHSPRFAKPDVPELAHDQRYVPARISLQITFLYAVCHVALAQHCVAGRTEWRQATEL
jgi:hypothetical protein